MKNTNGNGKPVTDDVLRELAANVATMRSSIISQLMDPRRDVEAECGLRRLGEPIPVEVFEQLYERDAVARRVVATLPDECFAVSPVVYESEDEDEETEFEKAWAALGSTLEVDYAQSQEGAARVWNYLHRGDVLSGVGSYGVIFLGLDGDPREPAAPRTGQGLHYIRAFAEAQAQIAAYEQSPVSPRFGLPLTYTLSFNDPRTHQSGIGLIANTITVHHTRVIHLADNRGANEVFGRPRLLPVLDNVLSLRKVLMGSSEGYWKSGCMPSTIFETHPQLAPGEIDVDTAGLRDSWENMQNGLQKAMFTAGMSAKTLAPQAVVPGPFADVQLEAISIATSIPKRILLGSERGELSSAQDARKWTDVLRRRQTNYVTPRVICPFIDRLIWLGILPTPKGYSVHWPDLAAAPAKEQAEVAQIRTKAWAEYVRSGLDVLIPPIDFATKIMGMEVDEAAEMLAGAEDRQQDRDTDLDDDPELATNHRYPLAIPVGNNLPGPADGVHAHVHVAAPQVIVAAPPAPSVTVHVPAPNVTVQPTPVTVVQNQAPRPKRKVKFDLDDNGDPVGATIGDE